MDWLDRTIVLVGYYPPPLGGESVHVRDLARRLGAGGAVVRVINARRGAPPGAEYRCVTGRLDYVRALLTSLDPGALLHLHANGHSGKSWTMIAVAALALRRRRAVGVLTLHSGSSPDYLATLGRTRRGAVRVALAPFTRVICTNNAIRSSLVGLGVAPSRLPVIPAYLGLPDAGPPAATDAALAERFSPVIATAGHADPEYGLPLLFEALAALRSRFPALGCLVMGAGADGSLERLVAGYGVADRVACLAELPRERYLALVASADVFVRPSYVDGDALSVREALDLGLPVVASDTGFRPEGVTLFRRGDPRDLADKLHIALARTDGQCRPMGETPSDAFARILTVYEDAIRHARAGASSRVRPAP